MEIVEEGFRGQVRPNRRINNQMNGPNDRNVQEEIPSKLVDFAVILFFSQFQFC